FGSEIRMPMLIAETALTTPVPIPGGPLVRRLLMDRIMGPEASVEIADFALDIVRSCRPLTRGRHAAILADMDLGDAARHLTVPTLVIAGRYDRLLPERMSRLIADTLQETGHLSDYHVWPTGHLTNLEASEKFNTELARIIDRTGLRPAAAG
ncbi:alpha/beta fold hydrolase, partial [Nocardia brevicatena]|uniref:alpha/beta fold hydrolase n=1 Tax=Nocardia brevicatena TaxID=37327 RepID=UPI00059495FA